MNRLLKVIFISLSIYSQLQTQSISLSAYQDLEYRMIGPFRGGRTVGAIGIPSQPNIFFIGVNNGGVWKTDDYGRTWKPIMDQVSTGSIGDIAVSPNKPNIIYVGTGEGLHRPDLSTGDGIFKSIDGGKTWNHIGLPDIQQVGRIIVDPIDPNIVFVAGLGHPYGANEERGVFRTIDGGKSWSKVLYINHNTGAIQVEFDPLNSKVLYADMWEHREGPWENGSFSGTKSGLYKSIDRGNTWKPLTKGLPTTAEGLGRVGIGISTSNPKIIYATVDATAKGGIYKSMDAGESWSLISTENRLWGRGSDFADIRVHPRDPNKVYVANTASYESDDGGKSWYSLKGAPGGDDYHRIWINPISPDIMIFAADQGATITVNAGKTWSSWYNQPTAQLYHISADNQFPYWVYGGQQESGAIGVASRGPGGQISLRDWIGVGSDEYANVVADPLNPDIIYGGKLVRFDKKTGQSQSIAPEALRSGQYRLLRTMPLLFHPADPHILLFASSVLWKSVNEGSSWEIISPDLSREKPAVPESIGDFSTPQLSSMARRGVIYSVAASPLDVNTIWAGTDDGQIHLTVDGGAHWKLVNPPTLKSWDKISQLDAGHFSKLTAYMSVNSFRKDDLKPHIYKTHDGGYTWFEIVNGIAPEGNAVNVIREDPKQPGLLYAGTEREVYFSIDDGIHWQSLRNNMPATSIRDLVVKENDLVIGTHGRSIWILDNISPLRTLANAVSSNKAVLFSPQVAYRVRDNMFHDTPFPPEEPAGQNPPDGAIIDYYLPKSAIKLSIDIIDPGGKLIRHYSNEQVVEQLGNDLPYPDYWIKPFKKISVEPGHHRLIWDLHHEPPGGIPRELSISAVYKKTPTSPMGPFVHPGQYTIRLNTDQDQTEKNIEVKLDPRVQISRVDLQIQTDLSLQCYTAYQELVLLKEKVIQSAKKLQPGPDKSTLESLVGPPNPDSPDILYSSITVARDSKETITSLQTKFLYLMVLLQTADVSPTSQTKKAIGDVLSAMNQLKSKIK
ncbi:MAG: glycoside hydrolase [Saprospiraceae bacterium]